MYNNIRFVAISYSLYTCNFLHMWLCFVITGVWEKGSIWHKDSRRDV